MADKIVKIQAEIEEKATGATYQCEDIIPQYDEITVALSHAGGMILRFAEPRWRVCGELLRINRFTKVAGDNKPSLENYSVWKAETENYSVYIRFYPYMWECGEWH